MFNDSINDFKMCLIYGKVEYYDILFMMKRTANGRRLYVGKNKTDLRMN